METVPICQNPPIADLDLRGRVEVDSYALVPSHTRFTDLLPVALGKIGYLEDLPYARGKILIYFWLIILR